MKHLAHSIRRWAWRLFGPWDLRPSRCVNCGMGLSSAERDRHGDTCTTCGEQS